MGPQQVHRDVVATVTGGSYAPKNENSQEHSTKVEAIRNRGIEKFSQEDSQKNIDRHNANKQGCHPFDAVNDAVKAAFAGRRHTASLQGRFVLGQALLQGFHHSGGVVSTFLHLVGPLLFDRCHSSFPCGKLFGR